MMPKEGEPSLREVHRFHGFVHNTRDFGSDIMKHANRNS